MKFLVYVSGKSIGGMMKKNVNLFSVLLFALSFVFISGCKESNSIADIETVFASDEAFQKAVEQQKADDLIGARESFKKIVVAQPTNSLARLHYAILLQDVPPTDPYAALSNFEAYLVLAPNSEKTELVEERIQKARKQISNRFDETMIEDHERKIANYVTHIRELNTKISELKNEIEVSKKVIAKIEESRDAEIVRNKRLNSIIETLSSGGAITASAPLPNANRTYKVRRGDTLWSIARDVYGDPNRKVDIEAANGIKEGAALVEGRELIIP